MDQEQTELQKKFTERFSKLPPVVQKAITSADVEKRLRQLADTHKLHIDQWDLLENEVMLALLGFEPIEDLPGNIQSEVGLDPAAAARLAGDISKMVFEPIRSELERTLDHPEVQATAVSNVDAVRSQMLAGAASTPVAPATPPAAPNTVKVERAPLPSSYSAAAKSHERRTIEGDPYREQLA